MILESLTTEQQLIEQFLNTLRTLPDVHSELDQREPTGLTSDGEHDARIDLRVASKSFILLIEVKKKPSTREMYIRFCGNSGKLVTTGPKSSVAIRHYRF